MAHLRPAGIGLIEEKDGGLAAYECQWQASSKIKITAAFPKAYPNGNFEIIDRENYLS